jgi:sn-glycerol 3-phosphate transport system permease protein
VITSSLGGMVLLLSSAIKNIDPAQYEAAMIDGASWAQIKLKIVLPQILKSFSVLLLFGIVGALQIWETIYILAPFETTASMMYRVISDGFFFGKYGLASAECVIMAIVIVLITKGKERIEKA